MWCPRALCPGYLVPGTRVAASGYPALTCSLPWVPGARYLAPILLEIYDSWARYPVHTISLSWVPGAGYPARIFFCLEYMVAVPGIRHHLFFVLGAWRRVPGTDFFSVWNIWKGTQIFFCLGYLVDMPGIRRPPALCPGHLAPGTRHLYGSSLAFLSGMSGADFLLLGIYASCAKYPASTCCFF